MTFQMPFLNDMLNDAVKRSQGLKPFFSFQNCLNSTLKQVLLVLELYLRNTYKTRVAYEKLSTTKSFRFGLGCYHKP